jgi:hypothetical protein
MKRLTGDINAYAKSGAMDLNVLHLYGRLESYEDIGLTPLEVQLKLLSLDEYEELGFSPNELRETLNLPRPQILVRCKDCEFWKNAPEGVTDPRGRAKGKCLLFEFRAGTGKYKLTEDFYCRLGTRRLRPPAGLRSPGWPEPRKIN